MDSLRERAEVIDMDYTKARGKRVDWSEAYPSRGRRSAMSCPPGQFIVRGEETGEPYWFTLPRNHQISVGLRGSIVTGTQGYRFVPDRESNDQACRPDQPVVPEV